MNYTFITAREGVLYAGSVSGGVGRVNSTTTFNSGYYYGVHTIPIGSFHVVLLHELGHVLGLFHEQSRDDLTSHLSGVNASGQSRTRTGIDALNHGKFDFASMMLYSGGNFAYTDLSFLIKRNRYNTNYYGIPFASFKIFNVEFPRLNLDNIILQSKILSHLDQNTNNTVSNTNGHYQIAHRVFSSNVIANYPVALALMVAYGAFRDSGNNSITNANQLNNTETYHYYRNWYYDFQSDLVKIDLRGKGLSDTDTNFRSIQARGKNEQLIYDYIKNRIDNNPSNNERLEYFYTAPVIEGHVNKGSPFLSDGDIDALNYIYD